jgi:hypothetical protein
VAGYRVAAFVCGVVIALAGVGAPAEAGAAAKIGAHYCAPIQTASGTALSVKVLYGPAACGTADTILGDWLAADSQGAQAVAAAGWQCEDDLNLRLLLGGVARCWAPPATSATRVEAFQPGFRSRDCGAPRGAPAFTVLRYGKLSCATAKRVAEYARHHTSDNGPGGPRGWVCFRGTAVGAIFDTSAGFTCREPRFKRMVRVFSFS